MILVSACLLGINCKYNGNNNKNEKVIKHLNGKLFIPICPEQLGGMPTPRHPCEIIHNGGLDKKECIKVINNQNKDKTQKFINGANESLKIAKLYNCKKAILKEGSPSCGSNYIYDGSFTSSKINGEGITTSLLKKNGIKVISENEL